MKLKVVDSRLSLGSAYKLIVVGWVLSWGALFGTIFGFVVIAAITSGSMTINGEVVEGIGAIAVQILPFVIMLPLIIVFHAFVFGGLLVAGLALYRLYRPIEVVHLTETDKPLPHPSNGT